MVNSDVVAARDVVVQERRGWATTAPTRAALLVGPVLVRSSLCQCSSAHIAQCSVYDIYCDPCRTECRVRCTQWAKPWANGVWVLRAHTGEADDDDDYYDPADALSAADLEQLRLLGNIEFEGGLVVMHLMCGVVVVANHGCSLRAIQMSFHNRSTPYPQWR